MTRRAKLKSALVLLAACVAAPVVAQAQTWPAKPIKLIVPFAPGGNTDIAARLIATGLSGPLGQQILVENHAGAGGTIGTDLVAKAAPDGYTLLLGHIGALTINPAIYEKLPYDTLKDFEPIGLSVVTPLVLVSAPSNGIHSVRELVAKAKAEPGKLTFATAGSGSAAHMAAELFNQTAGIKTTHIPFKGAGPSTTSLVSGDVTFSFNGLAPAQPFVKAGKLLALAVSSKTPSPLYPGVPTMQEAGVPGFEMYDWNGIMAPKGTPKVIIDRFNAELVKFLNLPETRTKLAQMGFEGRPGTPAQFDTWIRSELVKWNRAAKAANIKAD
jgi:tripartite-type tricarboxylate transporter receptor subunit TctC